MIAEAKTISKSALAQKLNIPKSTLYYKPKLPQKDWHLKNRIETILEKDSSYGHKRLADALGVNKKRILRVMKIFGLKPYRRRGRRQYRKTNDLSQIFPNLLQSIPFPQKYNIAWVSDFTRLLFHGKAVYLATVMDIFNRMIVGWCLLTCHTAQLTITALIDAVEKHGRPEILHSDQGVEYKSKTYINFAQGLGIQISMSRKASPWENCYQEAFYSQFKVDLGDWNRFKTLGELAAAVYQQIHYYNHQRIHTALKMPPAIYSQRQQETLTTIQLT